MKTKRLLALFLLSATLIGLLAGCKPKTNPPAETSGSGDITTEDPNGGDTWMDIWDQDAEFVPLTNDTAYDTNGPLPSGSWFDSFKTSKSLYWAGNGNAKLSYPNGQMRIEGNNANASGTVSRTVKVSECFEVELRAKMEYFGNDNGIYVSYNGVRIILYFHETKLRLNVERNTETAGRTSVVYTDVGNEWHTYRIRVTDRVAQLYFDGEYMTSAYVEGSGIGSGQLGIVAFPANAYNPTVFLVEYLSYTVLESDLSIATPTRGAVCGSGNTDVMVTADISDALVAENDKVDFYLNGVYAGNTDSQNPTMIFEDLTPGFYKVYAKCGDVTSAERSFSIASDDTDLSVDAVYSTAEKLQSSYILKYTVNGNGSVSAGDGVHALKLTHSSAKLSYEDAGGTQSILSGSGDYIAVVDGGICYLWRDQRFVASFKMPLGAGETVAKSEGAVSGLTVEAHNATLFAERFDGQVDLNVNPGNIGYNYAVEFDYTKGSALALVLSDDAYLLDLRFGEDGSISGLSAPHGNSEREMLGSAGEGTNHYRVQISAGIAQLMVNNEWVASWRMPATVAPRNLFAKGAGIGFLQIRTVNERYYYAGSPTDSDWDAYFENKADLSSTAASCLKVYSKNTEISTTLNMSAATRGSIYLMARYFRGNGVVVSYDFNAEHFMVGNAVGSMSVLSNEKLIITGDVTLTLRVNDMRGEVLVDGRLIGSFDVKLNGWGNAGYLNGSTAELKSFTYEGDGCVAKNSTTHMVAGDHTVGILELGQTIYACGEQGTLASTDGGYTFYSANDLPRRSYNMIVLQSGKVLSLIRSRTNQGLRYLAYVSSDNGATYAGPYSVNSDYNDYRFTMNGKLMQASSGRIFFVSGETENENYGRLWIYYSDNDGVIWKKAKTEFNYDTTGCNLQEGVIVELDNGVLRMYAREGGGFLAYSDSHDGGRTWDTDMKYSNFASVLSAFNVTKDYSTGAIYMAWEYNNTNDSTIEQYTRTRVALAVSYDNAKTWQYLADCDELNNIDNASWVHWNIGVWATSESIFVTFGKNISGTWYNYMMRISKDSLQPLDRFSGLHAPARDPHWRDDGRYLVANSGILGISSDTGRVYASGETYQLDTVNGKRTMLSAEMIASFLNGKLTVDGNRAVISVGNAEYIFTAGSSTASIAGAEKTMTYSTPVAEKNSIWISIEDLDTVLGLTSRCTASGSILLTVDPTPVDPERLLSVIGIW